MIGWAVLAKGRGRFSNVGFIAVLAPLIYTHKQELKLKNRQKCLARLSLSGHPMVWYSYVVEGKAFNPFPKMQVR